MLSSSIAGTVKNKTSYVYRCSVLIQLVIIEINRNQRCSMRFAPRPTTHGYSFKYKGEKVSENKYLKNDCDCGNRKKCVGLSKTNLGVHLK